ncbi:hypothetical protein Tco_0783501, partial [Tanacetum coccineum]
KLATLWLGKVVEEGEDEYPWRWWRPGVVRDEIFSQRYRLRSLEREAALWHAIYRTQRENHDLKMRIAEERHERLELIDRVARMELRHEFRGE